jgi:hypothetical protein
MKVRVDRKVLIHLILIGIILTVVFLITHDLKQGDYNPAQVAPVRRGYDHILDDLGI